MIFGEMFLYISFKVLDSFLEFFEVVRLLSIHSISFKLLQIDCFCAFFF